MHGFRMFITAVLCYIFNQATIAEDQEFTIVSSVIVFLFRQIKVFLNKLVLTPFSNQETNETFCNITRFETEKQRNSENGLSSFIIEFRK